jgi:hypothetical protein
MLCNEAIQPVVAKKIRPSFQKFAKHKVVGSKPITRSNENLN